MVMLGTKCLWRDRARGIDGGTLEQVSPSSVLNAVRHSKTSGIETKHHPSITSVKGGGGGVSIG